ncbi:MAG: hypothetical protein Q4C47_09170, partial [Planctomycetia bacterium]|nr:hypothetical protein [Planctomycetia bacterium]
GGLLWDELVTEFRQTFIGGLAGHIGEFIAATKRGIVPERRTPPGATVRLIHADEDREDREDRKVGDQTENRSEDRGRGEEDRDLVESPIRRVM